MTIQELITLTQNRIANLSALRTSAINIGDIAQVQQLENDITETQHTLNKLLSL